MPIYIGYQSALVLYASPRCTGLAQLPPASIGSIADAESSVPRARTGAIQAFCGIASLPSCPVQRIDVISPSQARRTAAPPLAAHAWSCPPPPGSFVQAARDVYLATPELCFLQMAQTLTPAHLMALGMAMCGRYWPADVRGHMLKTSAMTSVDRLTAFLETVPSATDSVNKARRAASWLADNAWSPMESSTYLLLCLPRTMGGYALPRPELNREYVLSREAQAIVQQETCYVDLCWHHSCYGIEYYGREYHRDTERDLARELALQHDGIEIRPVAYRQIKNTAERNEVVRQSAERVDKRLRPATERIARKRRELLREAFARGRYTNDGTYELELPDYALPAALCQECIVY